MADLCWLLAQALSSACAPHLQTAVSQPPAIAPTAGATKKDSAVPPTPPPVAPAAGPVAPHFSGARRPWVAAVAAAAGESSILPDVAPGIARDTPAENRWEAPPSPAEAAIALRTPAPPQGGPIALNRAAPLALASRPQFSRPGLCGATPEDCTALLPTPALPTPDFVRAPRLGPRSGPELYRQRQLALYSGHLYTRVAPDAYRDRWVGTTTQPTYSQWRALLAQEAAAVAAGQGPNRLEIVVGDSIGLWLPTETLPRDRLWLNQGISGDTTAGVLARLDAFAGTRPTVIHLMVGVNDLKTNVPEAQIMRNLEQIVAQLQRQHPQARLVLYSVLPTRREDIRPARVRSLNNHIAYLAAQRSVAYRDLQGLFRDQGGSLRADLTTDGIHLTPTGYALWQQVMLAVL